MAAHLNHTTTSCYHAIVGLTNLTPVIQAQLSTNTNHATLSYADGTRSKFLVQETRTRNLAQETCIQVAPRTTQVSRTRNMADDRDDKEFQILFFSGLHSIINKMAKKTKKDETTNNNQQQNIVKKTKRTSNQ